MIAPCMSKAASFTKPCTRRITLGSVSWLTEMVNSLRQVRQSLAKTGTAPIREMSPIIAPAQKTAFENSGGLSDCFLATGYQATMASDATPAIA